jgi:hypothetical protein
MGTRTVADYHRAVDRWLRHQGPKVMFCLVQIDSADLRCMPRLYLATAAEIASRLHASIDQLGDTALYEQYEVQDAQGRNTVETLPAEWQFSEQRIAQLMANESSTSLEFKFSDAAPSAAVQPTVGLHFAPLVN